MAVILRTSNLKAEKERLARLCLSNNLDIGLQGQLRHLFAKSNYISIELRVCFPESENILVIQNLPQEMLAELSAFGKYI